MPALSAAVPLMQPVGLMALIRPSLTNEVYLYALSTEVIQVIDCLVKGTFAANYHKLHSPFTTQPIVCVGLVTFTHEH